MKWFFTQEQIQAGLPRLELPEDELVLEGQTLEGEGRQYRLTGVATIEGERYHDFSVDFCLAQDPRLRTRSIF